MVIFMHLYILHWCVLICWMSWYLYRQVRKELGVEIIGTANDININLLFEKIMQFFTWSYCCVDIEVWKNFLTVLLLQIIRHARKLPMGDVTSLKGAAPEEEPLDEDDLT